MHRPFDNLAESYDNWYETPKGKQIFEAELKCLRRVCPVCDGRWMEIGVGTGRFADGMGIREGIDPSRPMLNVAASRQITVHQGHAEDLPFDANTFDGLLLAFTLCFIESPETAVRQCHRVLKQNGRLLIGMIPAGSAWGRACRVKKKQGHPIYSRARLLTIEKTIAMAHKAGFILAKSACTLLGGPDESAPAFFNVENDGSEEAGFAALLFLG